MLHSWSFTVTYHERVGGTRERENHLYLFKQAPFLGTRYSLETDMLAQAGKTF